MTPSPLIVSLAIAVALTQVATFSTTIYLHRSAAHRGLTLHPAVAWSFRFALWITTGLATKEWVAVHRKHHAFTDEAGDPHSPRLNGFWPVQLGNVFYYVREARNRSTIEKYAHDITIDRWDRSVFNHGFLGPLLGTIALCGLIGVGWGLLAAGLHAVTYVFFLSSSINGLCHSHGYRTFDNTATNIRWLALVTGGEGLHNNHHGFPRSPKFSLQAGEVDPSWPIIRLLTHLKLARAHQTIEEIGESRHPRMTSQRKAGNMAEQADTQIRTVAAQHGGPPVLGGGQSAIATRQLDVVYRHAGRPARVASSTGLEAMDVSAASWAKAHRS